MIAAYTAQTWQVSTLVTVGLFGSRVLISPPTTAENIDLHKLEADILYIRLHSMPEQGYLYGDPGWPTALTVAQIEQLKLTGSLVFLEGCFGAHLASAFLQAGALAVVGSKDSTYGKRWFLGESSQIGKRWLDAIRAGLGAGDALDKAISGKASASDWRVFGNERAGLSGTHGGVA